MGCVRGVGGCVGMGVWACGSVGVWTMDGTWMAPNPTTRSHSPDVRLFACSRACSVAMVLNSLAIDPRRVWKGSWRIFHEQMLDCCIPLETVQREGITLTQAACLAKCNGALAGTSRCHAHGARRLDPLDPLDPLAHTRALHYHAHM